MGAVPRYDKIITSEKATPGSVNVAGSGTRAVGQVLSQGAELATEHAVKQKQAREASWLNEESVTFQKDYVTKQDEMQKSFHENPFGYSDAMDKWLVSRRDSTMLNAPSADSRTAWTSMADKHRKSMVTKSKSWESTREVENFATKLDNSIGDLDQIAYRTRNFEELDGILNQVETATVAGSTFLAGDVVAEVNEKGIASVTRNMWNGIFEDDPQHALDLIDDKKLDGKLKPEDIAKMRKSAAAQVKKLEKGEAAKLKLQQAEAKENIKNIVSSLSDGNEVNYSQDDVLSSFTGDERTEIKDILQRAEALGDDMKEIQFASPEEVMEILGTRQETLSTSPDDYVSKKGELKTIHEAVARRQRAIEKDSAAYAVQSPYVQELEAIALTNPEDPEAQQKYISSVLNEQVRLGVSENKAKPLTGASADAMINMLEGSGSPVDRLGIMQSLQGTYGKHWPKVFAQLSKAGMSPTMTVVGTTNNQVAAKKLAESITEGKGAMESLAGKENITEINDGIEGALSEFAGSLRNVPSGARLYEMYSDSVYMLSLKYVQEGLSGGKAVKRAANDLINDNYEYRGSYRIPKEHDTNNVDHNLRTFMEKMQPADFDVLPGVSDRLTEEQAKEVLLDSIRYDGYFTNNQFEDGLLLYHGDGSPVTKDGKPLEFKFEDLANENEATIKNKVSDTLEGFPALLGF